LIEQHSEKSLEIISDLEFTQFFLFEVLSLPQALLLTELAATSLVESYTVSKFRYNQQSKRKRQKASKSREE
jgi:hypothetical protein